MTRVPLALLALLLVPWPALAQKVTLPEKVEAPPGLIMVAADTDCATLEWWAPDGGLQLIPSALLKDSHTAVGIALQPGRYRLQAIGAKGDKPAYAVTTVIVGGAPPVPPGPQPPGPQPPGPGPAPGPAPIPLDGLRVLILYESKDLDSTDPNVRAVLRGKPIRDFLNSVCVLGPDGKTHEWRIWDKDDDVTAAQPHWQEAMKRPRTTVPWLIISNGKAGFEGPLPKTVTATQELIRKFVPLAEKAG